MFVTKTNNKELN